MTRTIVVSMIYVLLIFGVGALFIYKHGRNHD
jgi:hypothetical protein